LFNEPVASSYPPLVACLLAASPHFIAPPAADQFMLKQAICRPAPSSSKEASPVVLKTSNVPDRPDGVLLLAIRSFSASISPNIYISETVDLNPIPDINDKSETCRVGGCSVHPLSNTGIALQPFEQG
jgi:hypothetical protein